VIVADISIPEAAIEDENVTLALTTARDLYAIVAPRAASTHKGTYGHLAVIAGSPGRSGAAAMCARGAIRTGVGLVTIITDAETAKLVHVASLESMTYSGADVPRFISTKSALLIGPGLPDDEASYKRVRDLIHPLALPMIIDASAINAFAARADEINPHDHPRVITPHPGELARLLGTTPKEINADRMGAAREAARVANCVAVLKGYQTLIADRDGQVRVNPTGNPGMATGGMGDVLSGIIGALLARGVDPFEAACTGVYLHGLAGDMLKEEMGDTGRGRSRGCGGNRRALRDEAADHHHLPPTLPFLQLVHARRPARVEADRRLAAVAAHEQERDDAELRAAEFLFVQRVLFGCEHDDAAVAMERRKLRAVADDERAGAVLEVRQQRVDDLGFDVPACRVRDLRQQVAAVGDAVAVGVRGVRIGGDALFQQVREAVVIGVAAQRRPRDLEIKVRPLALRLRIAHRE
jgi:hydroxyethylthiazole kinase-like uncharacterized protein yjeF